MQTKTTFLFQAYKVPKIVGSIFASLPHPCTPDYKKQNKNQETNTKTNKQNNPV